MMDPSTAALQQLQSALDGLGIPFCVVGSFASSARGVPRATMDIDLLARISRAQAEELAQVLGRSWSVDAQAIGEALRWRRAFNIFHLPTALKFDLFPAFDDFHASQLERATLVKIAEAGPSCPVATAEDVVLAKLQWYRSGGEVSEKQWRDILGVLAGNRSLDSDYLVRWANRLRVDDLLSKARAEAAAP